MTPHEGVQEAASRDHAAIAAKSVLVSFCNFSAPRAAALFRLEPGSNNLAEARVIVPHAVTGCTGMTSDGARIYVLSVSKGVHHLIVLTRNELEVVFCQPLPEVKDGHSVLVRDRKLYVVSTGTDEIIRYDLAGQGVSDPQVNWRATASGTDTHHINSITEWQGNLVASAFGPKFGMLWTSAVEGYIHDISRDARIKSGVYHPHSLSVRGDRLYYLESQRKLLCSLEGPLFSVPGYPRGVGWFDDDLVCIGSNVGRGLSKSTGLIANPADPGKPSGSCAITVGDVKTGRRLKHLDLGWVGGEIYDILVEDADQE